MNRTKIKLPPIEMLTQSVLVDHQIEHFAINHGLIQPFESKLLSGCSYDLRAGVTVRSRSRLATFKLSESSYVVESGECITVESLERVNLANHLFFALILNKHSVLAKGFYHPATAVDPGFNGPLALTFIHSGNVRFEIAMGDKIAKIAFYPVSPMPGRIYGFTQKPSYSEGSTDIALIVDTPRQADEEFHLSKVYGKPVEKLYDQMREIKRDLGLLELKRESERRQKVSYIVWGIIFALISGLSGSIVTANWKVISQGLSLSKTDSGGAKLIQRKDSLERGGPGARTAPEGKKDPRGERQERTPGPAQTTKGKPLGAHLLPRP